MNRLFRLMAHQQPRSSPVFFIYFCYVCLTGLPKKVEARYTFIRMSEQLCVYKLVVLGYYFVTFMFMLCYLYSIVYIRFFYVPCRVVVGRVGVPYYVRQRAINTPVFKTILHAHLASDDWRSRTIPIATKQFCKAQCIQGVFT